MPPTDRRGSGPKLRTEIQESRDFGSRSKQQQQLEIDSSLFSPSSGKVVAIKVHYLGPRRHEVFHKLLLGVRARIDFRDSTQLRVRTEDQVYAGSGPFDLFRLAV